MKKLHINLAFLTILSVPHTRMGTTYGKTAESLTKLGHRDEFEPRVEEGGWRLDCFSLRPSGEGGFDGYWTGS